MKMLTLTFSYGLCAAQAFSTKTAVQSMTQKKKKRNALNSPKLMLSMPRLDA